MIEWLTEPATALRPNGLPVHQLTCTDDDLACDFGATAGDNTCTFNVAVCLNVVDSRLPCSPTDVETAGVLRPAPGRSGTTDTSNRTALETALGQVGGQVQGVCNRPRAHRGLSCTAPGNCNSAPGANDGVCSTLVNFSPPLNTVNTCTAFAPIQVPLRQTTRGLRAASKTLQVTAFSSVGQKKSNSLKLTCNPHS
jgi:hypothetical protein